VALVGRQRPPREVQNPAISRRNPGSTRAVAPSMAGQKFHSRFSNWYFPVQPIAVASLAPWTRMKSMPAKWIASNVRTWNRKRIKGAPQYYWQHHFDDAESAD
jgi:hypothetical protein